MSESSPLIVINNITYAYPNGTQALKNVSLNINAGELIGIMGSNGAGKTTLIRTLNGLIQPQSGSIFINNENIQSKTIAEISKSVGIVFQNPEHQLFSNTVRDEIKFSLKNIFDKEELLETKIEDTLKMFHFEQFKEKAPLNLSGGQKKKLALASIVCRDPSILIFDEPTLGQDEKEIDFLIALLRKETQNNKTIIIVTHNIEFAYQYIPRVILMSKGRLLADGPTTKVLSNEQLIKKASLILPQLTQLKASLRAIGLEIPDALHTQEAVRDFLIKFFESRSHKGGLS
ncbi:MAG: Energy-coupling factor transporter ATP-binding protein EcfA2 [Promethearchaeota archaeon]|nr:MAG: Energy-coupling factor transporter ATP-binding protein EcfA2 [Candidatus Lokiarchaeota archaeon]